MQVGPIGRNIAKVLNGEEVLMVNRVAQKASPPPVIYAEPPERRCIPVLRFYNTSLPG